MSDSPPSQPALPPEGAASLLDQMFRLWIEPLIEERQLGLTRADVTKALVILPPSDALKVQINDEVQLIAQVEVTRSIEAGEAVTLGDVQSVAGLQPVEVDPNAGWIAFAKIGNEVIIAFDFRRNRQTASLLVERAHEFVATARASLEKGHLGPAIENGFAAMELAVKAEMYLIDDSPTTVHRERVAFWTDWVKLGNAPTQSDSVLSRLYEERPGSRYGDRPITMTEEEVGGALDQVQSVIEHARLRSAPRETPG